MSKQENEKTLSKVERDVQMAKARRALTDKYINKWFSRAEIPCTIVPILEADLTEIEQNPFMVKASLSHRRNMVSRVLNYYDKKDATPIQRIIHYRYQDSKLYFKVHKECRNIRSFLREYGKQYLLPLQAERNGEPRGWAMPIMIADIPELVDKSEKECFVFGTGTNANRVNIMISRRFQYNPPDGKAKGFGIDAVPSLVEVLYSLFD